jgi:hypothetical protein
MTIDPDSVAAALADSAQYMFGTLSTGWLYREGGLLAGTTGVPIATLNGIWAESSYPDARLVAEMLDRLDASGLPYCMQLRPRTPNEISDLARSKGMVSQKKVPLMVLEDLKAITNAPQVDRLSIRLLSPEEGSEHVRVAANAFGAPEELFGQLLTPEMLGLDGLRCYLGEVDGESVTTGLGVTLGSSRNSQYLWMGSRRPSFDPAL